MMSDIPPRSERLVIGFFGRCNVGKSTLINRITSQDVSVVSDIPGTTTDPVSKTMELHPLGAVTLIDTPGADDDSELGKARIARAAEVLRRTDIAVLVTDGHITDCERRLVSLFDRYGIPYLTAHNKCDLLNDIPEDGLYVSAAQGMNTDKLLSLVASLHKGRHRQIISDLVNKDDVVVLCIPVDDAAPRGRLILPQSAVLRELVEAEVNAVTVRDTMLKGIFDKLSVKPSLVITDSQVFGTAAEATPENVYLTSFSILMARYKGFLDIAANGALTIDRLRDGDRILICEGCTHRRQCADIGTVKLPRLLEKHTGKSFDYTFTSGGTFPEELHGFSLIIHCGGCMLNEREVLYRMTCAAEQGIPVTNYGTALAHLNGILPRSLEIFHEHYTY